MAIAPPKGPPDPTKDQLDRVISVAHRGFQRLRGHYEPKTSATSMFAELNLRPVDAQTAERRFAHVPFEDDR